MNRTLHQCFDRLVKMMNRRILRLDLFRYISSYTAMCRVSSISCICVSYVFIIRLFVIQFFLILVFSSSDWYSNFCTLKKLFSFS